MKKSILNFGTALKTAEQKQINGGDSGNCGGYPTYALCNSVCIFGTSTCEFFQCNRTTSGWFCVESGGSA